MDKPRKDGFPIGYRLRLSEAANDVVFRVVEHVPNPTPEGVGNRHPVNYVVVNETTEVRSVQAHWMLERGTPVTDTP